MHEAIKMFFFTWPYGTLHIVLEAVLLRHSSVILLSAALCSGIILNVSWERKGKTTSMLLCNCEQHYDKHRCIQACWDRRN